MLGLLSFIPGIGPIAQVVSSVATFIIKCKPCLIAIAILAAYITGDVRGRHIEGQKCKAADIAQQLAATKRDANIAKDEADAQRARAAQLEDEKTGLQKQVDDLAKLPKVAAACRLPKATMDALEKIR